MFINTKQAFRITGTEGRKFEAKAGWIGEVPAWVEKHWYFQSLCDGKLITAIVSKEKDKAEKTAMAK